MNLRDQIVIFLAYQKIIPYKFAPIFTFTPLIWFHMSELSRKMNHFIIFQDNYAMCHNISSMVIKTCSNLCVFSISYFIK